MTTITTEKIEELRRLAKEAKLDITPWLEREFAKACSPATILALLDLAQRAMVPQPQGQALPELPESLIAALDEYGGACASDSERLSAAKLEALSDEIENYARAYASQLALPAGPVPEPTPPDVRPDTVMAKPMPVNALWDAIGVYCEAVINDELAACGIGDKVDPRMRIGAAKRLIGLIGDRTDHGAPAQPANRLHRDAHLSPAVAQPVPAGPAPEIINDLRHSANVDGYTEAQAKFINSIAERLESPAVADEPALTIRHYRKKPVVIEAVQYTDAVRDAHLFDGATLPAGVEIPRKWLHPPSRKVYDADAYIETLEGRMKVSVGDWIITGVNGEHYSCKPDVFAATYEPVLNPSPAVAQPVADERAAFEQWSARFAGATHFAGESKGELWIYDSAELNDMWCAWQQRAALCPPAEEGGKS